MTDDEKRRRVGKAMDEMVEDVERIAIEIVRAKGHPDESDPIGRMAYETVAALVLAQAAYSAAMKSGEREWLRSVLELRFRQV